MIFSLFSKRSDSQSVTYINSSIQIAVSRGILIGFSAAGFLAVLSGLIDLTDSGTDTAVFLIFGTLITLICSYLTRYVSEKKLARSEIFLSVFSGFLFCILCSSFLYLLLVEGENFADAFFESAAAFTTTSLTTLDFTNSGRGVIFYRTSSQLLGSFAALVTAVLVVPISDDNFGLRMSGRAATQDVFPDRKNAVKSITVIYLVSITLLTLILLITELDFFHSLLLAMSAISTGGFSRNTNYFENSSVQLLLSLGMIITGTSVVIIWRLASRKVGFMLRSSEFHIYLSLILGATFLIFFWADEGTASSLGKSLFFAISSISTTGFHISPFESWPIAAAFFILLLVTIGPMSLSNGAGFQVHRLRILLALLRREMIRQLHPRAVVKIRAAGENVREERVRQVVVFQFLFTSTIFITSMVLTISGIDLYDAFSSAVAAITTAGPIRNPDGLVIAVSSFSSGERLALVPAMVAGRLYLLPVFISLGYLLSESRNFLRPRRRILQAIRSNK